jgi:hypothetical protein
MEASDSYNSFFLRNKIPNWIGTYSLSCGWCEVVVKVCVQLWSLWIWSELVYNLIPGFESAFLIILVMKPVQLEFWMEEIPFSFGIWLLGDPSS